MKRYIKSFVSLCLVLLLALAALPMQANADTDPFFVVGYTTQSYIEKGDSVTVTVTLIDGRIVSNVENQVKAEIDAAPYIE